MVKKALLDLKGTTGTQGTDGTKGQKGAQGTQGTQGTTGTQGTDGQKGQKGAPATIANDAANRITTAEGDGSLNAEAALTFDGNELLVSGSSTLKAKLTVGKNQTNDGLTSTSILGGASNTILLANTPTNATIAGGTQNLIDANNGFIGAGSIKCYFWFNRLYNQVL